MSELNYPDTERKVDNTIDRVKESVDQVSSKAKDFLDRSKGAVQDSSAKLRDSFGQLTDRTATYVHEQPVKSVLMAAAAGAAIAILAGMITHNRSRH